MKTKRSRESTASRIIVLVFLVAALLFTVSPIRKTLSGMENPEKPGIAPLIPQKVELSAGSFERDCESLTAVIQSNEIDLLNDFTSLRRLDLSGSTCYAEILRWSEAHPDVELRFTVELPNGKVYQNTDTELDLSGMNDAQLDTARELMGYLPTPTALTLGSCDGSDACLSVEKMLGLFEAYPDAVFDYSFALAGQTVDSETTALDLSAATPDELSAVSPLLPRMSAITEINMGSADGEMRFEDVGLVQELCPQAAVEYHFQLFEKDISTLDEEMNFWHVPMNDGGAAVRGVLPYMKNCTYVDMDTCGISNEDMAALQADFPDTKLVWRIWFAEKYSVRTDVEKILASKPSVGGVVYDEDARVLQYCTDLRFLDLGHNSSITDISFARCMPKLEVLVIAMNPLADISPLADCPHLEYLELNSTSVSDLSPLSELKELRHLNICNCENVSDISPLYGLTELERLWIGCVDPIPTEQVETFHAAAPDCAIDTTTLDPTQGGWRYANLTNKGWETWAKYGYFDFDLHPRYELLQQQFGYLEGAYAYTWLDPLY